MHIDNIITTIQYFIVTTLSYHSNLSDFEVEYIPGTQLCINTIFMTSINPEGFKKYSDVKHLVISNTSLYDFPRGIEHLSKLTSISFMNNKKTKNLDTLINLPKEIKEQITHLNLSMNNLENLFENIHEFKNLTHLYLTDNKLTSLPCSISRLNNLSNIWLENNKIKELPDDFGNLTNLKVLHLDNNRLSSFNNNFIKLQNLKWLSLRNNLFTKIPIPVYFLQNLFVINYSNNFINELLPNESDVILFRNTISLDTSFDNCELNFNTCFPNIKTLICSNNNISCINSNISQLQQLTYCILEGNEINQISSELFTLPDLIYLNLSNNLIRFIPFLKLDQQKCLKNINLSCNFISKQDDKVKGYGSDSLLNLFNDIVIGNQYESYITYEEALEMYYKENNPHWCIEELNKIKLDENVVNKAQHISDSMMQSMWNRVLKHFVYYKRDENENQSDDMCDSELIKNALKSEIFNNLQISDYSRESVLNKAKAEKMTRYLKLCSYDDNTKEADTPNNIKVKSYIKLFFENKLQEIATLNINSVNLDSIKSKLIYICDVGDERCITGQMQIAEYSYFAYSDRSNKTVKNISIFEAIKEKIAVIKEEMFVQAVIENHPQNVHDIPKWAKVFHNKLGINKRIDDPYAKINRTEIVAKTGFKLLTFLQLFSIELVAEKMVDIINKNPKLQSEIREFLIETVDRSKIAKETAECAYEYVITNYFEYRIERLFTDDITDNQIFEYKIPTALKSVGMIKIFEIYELIKYC